MKLDRSKLAVFSENHEYGVLQQNNCVSNDESICIECIAVKSLTTLSSIITRLRQQVLYSSVCVVRM